MVTTPVKWKDSTSVGFSFDNEQQSDVVQLANGNFLVVYSTDNALGSGSPPGSDVLGQLYSPIGVEIGGPIRLNISATANAEITPSVTALPGGGFAVSYISQSVSASGIPLVFTFDTNVMVDVFSSSGVFQRGATLLDAPVNDIQSGPQMAAVSAVNALTVWEDSDKKVVGRMFNPSTGDFIGTQFSVFNGSTDTGESIRGLGLTALTNGSYVAVWGNENALTNDAIEFRLISSDAVLSFSFNVSNVLAENYDPSIAALTNGRFVISYTVDGSGGTDSGIRLRVFNADGSAFTSEINPLTTTAGNQNNSAVVATDDGGFIVFWADATTFDINGQRFNSAGSRIGSEFTVEAATSTPHTDLEATRLADGRVVLSGTYAFSSDNDVRFAIWDPRDTANAPDPNGLVIATPASLSFTPAIGARQVFGNIGNDTVIVNSAILGEAINFDGGAGIDTLQLGAGDGIWDMRTRNVENFETLRFNNISGITFQTQTYRTFFRDFASFTSVVFGSGGFNNATTLIIDMGSTTSANLSSLNITGFQPGSSAGIFPTLGVDHLEINGDSSTENITGTSVADLISGGGGNDTLDGGEGDDTIQGGAGADSMIGGGGLNSLSYAASSAAVNASLLAGNGFGGDAQGDVFSGFQNLIGSSGNDTLTGDASANELTGLDGADLITAGGGADTIFGGDGNDTIIGGGGIDVLNGGAGDDSFIMEIGNFTDDVSGGDGTDTLDLSAIAFGGFTGFTVDMVAATYLNRAGLEGLRGLSSIERVIGSTAEDDMLGTAGRQEFYGGDGNDSLDGGADGDLIGGGAGSDSVLGGLGNDTLFAGLGDDTVRGGADNDLIFGSAGRNQLFGDDGADQIFASAGGDFIGGGAGNDTIRGSDGADTIYGGTGSDDIGGGAGNDMIFGAEGSNVIYAGLGNDTVQGGTGSDTIHGSAGRNQLFGNDGSDLIFASAAGDFIGGGAGNDTIFGGDGADTIFAGLGNDSIGGGAGNDLITAGAGSNRIFGGLGNDTIVAGSGRDVITGSSGADVFVFSTAASIGIGAGRDVITDFTHGVDHIDLHSLGATFNGAAGLSGGGARSFFYFAAGGLLIGDQTGDGVADWALELTGAPVIDVNDFLL